jgi:hypothetical protein
MRKRYIWAVLLALAAFLGWRYGYQASLKYFFRISGTVTCSGTLPGGRPGANSMLFVVARNERGVPVAVSKIINPVFPAEFELTSSSLIMPDLLTRKVYLEALLNTHGKLGDFRKGDLRGERQERANFISKKMEINLAPREK